MWRASGKGTSVTVYKVSGILSIKMFPLIITYCVTLIIRWTKFVFSFIQEVQWADELWMIESAPENLSFLLDIFFRWYVEWILNHLYFSIAFFLDPCICELSRWSLLFDLYPILEEFFIRVGDIAHVFK